MMSDDKLKPCPFCGGESVVSRTGLPNSHGVFCQNDDCCGRVSNHSSEDEAIAAWNRRCGVDLSGLKLRFDHELQESVVTLNDLQTYLATLQPKPVGVGEVVSVIRDLESTDKLLRFDNGRPEWLNVSEALALIEASLNAIRTQPQAPVVEVPSDPTVDQYMDAYDEDGTDETFGKLAWDGEDEATMVDQAHAAGFRRGWKTLYALLTKGRHND